MAYFLRNWRISAAALVAILLIGGAYAAARGDTRAPVAQASTESALLEAIASKDSDGDGLPDWEEALYGTNPHLVDTRGLGMSDGMAVAKGLIVPQAVANPPVASSTDSASAANLGIVSPAEGTLTDIFAKNFFSLYLAAKQQSTDPLTNDQITALVEQAVSELSHTVAAAPDFIQTSDIKVAGSGGDALRSYAAEAEADFAVHGSQLPKSELQYLQDALGGDTEAPKQIATIAKAYHDVAVALASLAVPAEAVSAHAELVNAMMSVGNSTSDFARVSTDPLSAMLALTQYRTSVTTMIQAFTDMTNVFAKAGVTLEKGAAGASFVNALSSATPNTP